MGWRDAGGTLRPQPFGLRTTAVKDHRESFWRDESVTEFHDVLHLEPVDGVAIQPQSEPTPRPNICRHIEPLRIAGDPIHIFPKGGLAANRDDPVAMMIVQIVCEHLATHPEIRVICPNASLTFGQRRTDLGELGERGRFVVAGHCGNDSRRPTMSASSSAGCSDLN